MEDEPGLSSSSDTKLLTLAELADELCPYYMSIGVSYDEYWHGDYTQLAHYQKTYEMIRERANYDAWLQGAYVYDAICAVAPVLHAFAKRGTTPSPYHKEPYGTKKSKLEKTRDVAAQVGAAKFFAFASRLNKKIETK